MEAGRKLSDDEKKARAQRRKDRTEARAKQIAEREELEKKRVAAIEKLIDDDRIDPNVRGQLCLMLNENFPLDYPRAR